MPGPAPQTKASLELAGSWRAKTRGDDPSYGAASVRAPKMLRGMALAEWKRIAPMMVAAGTLRDVDRSALTAYCECWADFVLASNELEKVVQSHGYERAIAAGVVSAKNKTRSELLKSATALGITPAAASRVTVKPQTPLGIVGFARKRG